MATYEQIQEYVRNHFGYTPKTCWIGHVKELHGLPVRRAHNGHEDARKNPCPDDKREHIRNALGYFGMLDLFMRQN